MSFLCYLVYSKLELNKISNNVKKFELKTYLCTAKKKVFFLVFIKQNIKHLSNVKSYR